MTPLVTIGMPAFQNAATVERAINSVRAQGFGDWRLIVTDDGSSDDTLKFAQRAATQDNRIEVLRNSRRLGYMNFRVSLSMATSRWFVWLAGDDYWSPRFLEATLAEAEAHSEAVSILPRWTFAGLNDPAPKTFPLDGSHEERVRRFLAAPGGTRMYGLTRLDAMRSAFPRRAFNAYDWYLVLGLLKLGPQIEVPEMLLFREQTPVRSYVETAMRLHPGLVPSLPVLRMSLAAMATGRVPLGNWKDLLKLNLRKHEEHLAYLRPARLARRLGLMRALGLPISSQPERTRAIAEELSRTTTDRREGAAALLERLANEGDAASAIALGRLRCDGILRGNAEDAFEQAMQLGNPLGAFHLARLRHERGEIPDETFRAIASNTAGPNEAEKVLAAKQLLAP